MSTKIKIDFSVPIKDLTGAVQMTGGTADLLSKNIASIIGANTQGDPWKFGSWAMDVYQGKVLELDQSDLEVLKTWLKDAQYAAFIKMQVLQVIADAEATA